MILIADSGSTKTSWILTNGLEVIKTITTVGYNPHYFNDDDLIDSIKSELLPFLDNHTIDSIFFYGSGCSSEPTCAMVKSALWELFPNTIIKLNHDLHGAAIALLKDNEGIACILGTGSNSCHWDGNKIIQNVPSVGYLFGDEGSGTHIGKTILKGILEEKAPSIIIDDFYKYYHTSFDNVLIDVYNTSNPVKFLSSICIFANKNINNDWVREIIKGCFTDFIENQIIRYNNYKNIPISFTGSIAYYFNEPLMEVCSDFGLKIGTTIKNPINGLFEFHTM